MTGLVDVNLNNILISKKCLKTVLIDNDGMEPFLSQYGSPSPFIRVSMGDYGKNVLSEEDYKKAPLERALILEKPSIKTLKKTFFGFGIKRV